MDTKPGLTVTSYSDYMRCLAAKYSDHSPVSGEHPVPVSPPTMGQDLLPILAAQQSLKAAPMALLNPFLSQVAERQSPLPVLVESIKRHKEDPLDLRDKMKKIKEESKSPSPVSSPLPVSRLILDWSVEEVAEFVAGVGDCRQYAKVIQSFTLLNFQCIRFL